MIQYENNGIPLQAMELEPLANHTHGLSNDLIHRFRDSDYVFCTNTIFLSDLEQVM